MTISQLDDMWAAFNVREERLNDLTMGKEIDVMIPALGNKEAKMKIFYVRDMGSYATWGATKAYGDYDSKTFEVKARPVKTIENFRPAHLHLHDAHCAACQCVVLLRLDGGRRGEAHPSWSCRSR